MMVYSAPDLFNIADNTHPLLLLISALLSAVGIYTLTVAQCIKLYYKTWNTDGDLHYVPK